LQSFFPFFLLLFVREKPVHGKKWSVRGKKAHWRRISQRISPKAIITKKLAKSAPTPFSIRSFYGKICTQTCLFRQGGPLGSIGGRPSEGETALAPHGLRPRILLAKGDFSL
jgi:hypothetical protein